MTIKIKQSVSVPSNLATKKPSSRSKALPVIIDLNQPGRLRVGHLLTLFSVSHAGFYKGMGTKYPYPSGNDGRPYWNTKTIVSVLDEGKEYE